MSYQHRGSVVSLKICSLFSHLNTQTYDEVAPMIGSWTELALTQQFTTVDELVERVSTWIWNGQYAPACFSRFLKEFRNSPHRSAQARSFVDEVCTRFFLWFTAASAEDLQRNSTSGRVAVYGGNGFIEGASFVGHFIECGLLDHELVQSHLVKALTHHYPCPAEPARIVRANAVFRLFVAAGNTLLQGLLEPEDVRTCFEILETQLSRPGGMAGLSTTKLEELRELHATWLQRKDESEQRDVTETEEREGEEGEVVTEILAEVEIVETPIAFAPQDLPTTVDIDIPSPILQGVESSSALQDVESSPGASTDDWIAAVSSPTLSISTLSDLTSTEFDEDIGEGSGGRISTRHETFYLVDGNVEIVCGHTIFRVHSPIVSFSSLKLRDMLSPSTLLNAPTPEGCPRVIFKDNTEDFAVLLKMIYTPGFLARNTVPEFTVFGSLLRMTAKYGFSDIREALVKHLKGAYPTKWEDFEAAKALGENVFGLPKPHPNAVLNLLLEQRIKFALPFAAYRAALAGFSSLTSDEPGTALPRLTLASIIYGMEKMRREMVQLSHSIVYDGNLRVCPQEECILNVGTNLIERRMEALRKIFNIMIEKSKGDLLSPLLLGDLVCVNCSKILEDAHLRHRERFVWRALAWSWGKVVD